MDNPGEREVGRAAAVGEASGYGYPGERERALVEGCLGARNVAVRAERLGREARAEWIWRSKVSQCARYNAATVE